MIAYGQDSFSEHRYAFYNATDEVWTGTEWVPFDEDDGDDYMQDATYVEGTDKTYLGSPPPSATYYELYVWAGNYDDSYIVDADDIEPVTDESGDPLPATRKLYARLRKANGDPFDPVGNVVELIDPTETFGVRRQSTGAVIVPAYDPDQLPAQVPFQYTRTGVGDYEYEIAENGLFVEYGWRYEHPVTHAIETHVGTSSAQPAGTYATTEDVYEELGEENALIHGNLSSDGTNADSPAYIRDALRYSDVRVNLKLGAYSPPPAELAAGEPISSTIPWVDNAINEAATKYAAGALLNKRQKQGNLVNANSRTSGDELILAGDELLQMLVEAGLPGVTLVDESADDDFVADAPVAVEATVDEDGRTITPASERPGIYWDGSGVRWN